MYRHGRPDVVCVVSSEFLFLPPPFFAAPTVFLSHPRPFFPRFFLSLFRSPITYLRSSGAQLPLAAPRFHAFDTINDPGFAPRDRRNDHPRLGFPREERGGACYAPARDPTNERTKAKFGKKAGGGEGSYRIGRIRSEFSKRNLYPRTIALAFHQQDKSPFLSPLHRSSLTFIGRVYDTHSLTLTSPCVTVDSVKSSLGMTSKRSPSFVTR